MHKNAMKCNKTLSKWCKNKHGASKIIDTFETYHRHIGGLALPHLVLVHKGLYAHLQWRRPGSCEGAQKRKEDAAMVAAEDQ
jgi:hypothetical protein